jgi:hypothetical protein
MRILIVMADESATIYNFTVGGRGKWWIPTFVGMTVSVAPAGAGNNAGVAFP